MADKWEDKECFLISIDFNEVVPPEKLRELQKYMTNEQIIRFVAETTKKIVQSYTTGEVAVVKVSKPQFQ